MAKPVVYIIIYSLYHHVYKLSLSVKEGLESKGVEVKLFQVPETLSNEILVKMQAPEKLPLPYITIDNLCEPDGILFGFPTRFGALPAQMKSFLDASGSLWAKGALSGKFVGTFFSTASQHGGQETTALTAVTYFAHHGMLYVPFGFANAAMNKVDEVVGGSAYGSGTMSDGDGSRQPTETELSVAINQGVNFAVVVNTFVRGRDSADPLISNKSAAPPTANGTTAAPSTGAGTGTVAATTAATAAATAGVGAGAATSTNKASTGHSVFNETSSSTANVAATTAATAAAGAANVKTLLANSTPATNKATSINPTTNANSAFTTTTTTSNGTSTANPNTTTPNTAITATTATTATNTAAPSDPTAASKVGANAGATAAGNANIVKESIVPTKDKTKKKKKWFCCM